MYSSVHLVLYLVINISIHVSPKAGKTLPGRGWSMHDYRPPTWRSIHLWNE